MIRIDIATQAKVAEIKYFYQILSDAIRDSDYFRFGAVMFYKNSEKAPVDPMTVQTGRELSTTSIALDINEFVRNKDKIDEFYRTLYLSPTTDLDSSTKCIESLEYISKLLNTLREKLTITDVKDAELIRSGIDTIIADLDILVKRIQRLIL